MKKDYTLLKVQALILSAVLIPALIFAQPKHNKKVMGYYAQWAIYARDYNVWDIDASKLTHLMYAFFSIDYNAANPGATKLLSVDPYADFEQNEGGHPWNDPYKGNFADMRDLKIKYPHLKIIISVGGWTLSQNFPAVAQSAVARQALAADMVNMMKTYTFIDGFDIDWEFPIIGGTEGNEYVNGRLVPAQPHTPDDNKNLVLLVKEMRKQFDANFTGSSRKLVTIAAGNNVSNVKLQYIGPKNRLQGMTDDLSTYCDLISYIGFDFGGNWRDTTCYNAPIQGSGSPVDPLYNSDPKKVQALDVLTNIYLNDIGIPANKLVMGMPFYGKVFENVATAHPLPKYPGLFERAPRVNQWCPLPQAPKGSWDELNCENSGAVEFCDLAGLIGTNPHHFLSPSNPSQLTSAATSAGWVKYWDPKARLPYIYNATQNKFLMYDDERSIGLKSQFVLNQGIAGAMIWELSQDQRGTSRLLAKIDKTFTAGSANMNDEGNDENISAADQFSNHLLVSVQPNPAVDKIYITSQNGIVLKFVTVLTPDGRQLVRYNNFVSGSSIDLSKYPQGTYMIAITDTDGNTDMEKVIKQ